MSNFDHAAELQNECADLRERLAEAVHLLNEIEAQNFDWGGPEAAGILRELYAFLAKEKEAKS